MNWVLYYDNTDINHSKSIELTWKELIGWMCDLLDLMLSCYLDLAFQYNLLFLKNINWLLFVQLFRNVISPCREWKILLYCSYSRSITKTLRCSWTDQWQLVEFRAKCSNNKSALAFQHRKARRNASFFYVKKYDYVSQLLSIFDLSLWFIIMILKIFI